jgi:anti-sigma regulatory factor (Ser/Thr protein kinase)
MPRVGLAGSAVADVLHLLAELIENATAFSPPETAVTVRGAVVGGGFAVGIEDQGLGMNPERLDEANEELAGSAAGAELPESDRLGLFTVGRLAARQGVRVTLRRGRDDGTTAVVLIPGAILVGGATGREDGETGEFELRLRAVPEPAVSAGRPASGPVSAPVRAAGTERTGIGLPKRPR